MAFGFTILRRENHSVCTAAPVVNRTEERIDKCGMPAVTECWSDTNFSHKLRCFSLGALCQRVCVQCQFVLIVQRGTTPGHIQYQLIIYIFWQIGHGPGKVHIYLYIGVAICKLHSLASLPLQVYSDAS